MEAMRLESPNPDKGQITALTALLEFDTTGLLKTILLNAGTDGGQRTLERALFRILKPDHKGWISRLMRRVG